MVFSEVIALILSISSHLKYASTTNKNMLLKKGPTKSIWIRCHEDEGHFHGCTGTVMGTLCVSWQPEQDLTVNSISRQFRATEYNYALRPSSPLLPYVPDEVPLELEGATWEVLWLLFPKSDSLNVMWSHLYEQNRGWFRLWQRKRSAISNDLERKCYWRVVKISWKLFVAGLSGERRSLNNVYVLLPIKLNIGGTWRSSSMLFAKKKLFHQFHKSFPFLMSLIKTVYLPDSSNIFGRFFDFRILVATVMYSVYCESKHRVRKHA